MNSYSLTDECNEGFNDFVSLPVHLDLFFFTANENQFSVSFVSSIRFEATSLDTTVERIPSSKSRCPLLHSIFGTSHVKMP